MKVWVTESYAVVGRPCANTGCDAVLGEQYPGSDCPGCFAIGTKSLRTACGCPLDVRICTMHRDASMHRHCQTCGVPVFAADGVGEYDDHTCPPGFVVGEHESEEARKNGCPGGA